MHVLYYIKEGGIPYKNSSVFLLFKSIIGKILVFLWTSQESGWPYLSVRGCHHCYRASCLHLSSIVLKLPKLELQGVITSIFLKQNSEGQSAERGINFSLVCESRLSLKMLYLESFCCRSQVCLDCSTCFFFFPLALLATRLFNGIIT